MSPTFLVVFSKEVCLKCLAKSRPRHLIFDIAFLCFCAMMNIFDVSTHGCVLAWLKQGWEAQNSLFPVYPPPISLELLLETPGNTQDAV
jgi:lipoprotein signal peptidase